MLKTESHVIRSAHLMTKSIAHFVRVGHDVGDSLVACTSSLNLWKRLHTFCPSETQQIGAT